MKDDRNAPALTNIYLPLPILYALRRQEVFSLEERWRELPAVGMRS
jgi:hypothetical protein